LRDGGKLEVGADTEATREALSKPAAAPPAKK
jgi:hypothetical protein